MHKKVRCWVEELRGRDRNIVVIAWSKLELELDNMTSPALINVGQTSILGLGRMRVNAIFKIRPDWDGQI